MYLSLTAVLSHVSHKHARTTYVVINNQIEDNASSLEHNPHLNIVLFTCICVCVRVVLFIMLTGVPPFQRPVKGLLGGCRQLLCLLLPSSGMMKSARVQVLACMLASVHCAGGEV